MNWISDDEAEKALDWLRDNAPKLGEAKRLAVKAESMVKRIKALEMKRSNAASAAAKEVDALCSEAYLEAINTEAQCAGDYEYMRAMKDAATAKIEAWRSLTATQRALTK